MNHAWTRSRCALQNGRAVENNRLAFAAAPRGSFFNRVGFGNSEFDKFGSVVERQIQKIFALAGNQIFYEHDFVGLILRRTDGEPAPAFLGFHIQVQTAFSNRRHVRQIEPRFGERPACVNRRGVGDEAHAHPGGVARQIPDGLAHDAFGLGGQAVVKIFGVRPATAFDAKLFDVGPDNVGRGI